jgi:uncharacterized membrane protein YeaQ/YmgE (transglycosylase-associated protein family)
MAILLGSVTEPTNMRHKFSLRNQVGSRTKADFAAGFLFDRLAGPSWLARQFSGSTRGIVTSALVGIAGALIGYHIAVLLALGGGIVTSVIAAALGATVVLFAWRMAK